MRRESTGGVKQVFSPKEYAAIKARLSFERNYAVTLLILVADWLLIAAAAALLRTPHWAAYLTSQCLLAIVFFHNFGILHEAGHGNTSSSRRVNQLTGLYASVLCLMPFLPWVYIHQKHHVWAGNAEQDPTARNLKRWRARGSAPWLLRVAWRSWLPLGAFAQHLVFWGYPWVLLRQDKRKLWPCVASVLLLPASYLLLHWLWPEFVQLRNFALAFAIYLGAEELVNFPHHSDLFKFEHRLPLWEQWKASRSCDYPWLVSELLVLNFNYHAEHHLYPSLPWYRLRAARKWVREGLGHDYVGSVGIAWNLENRSRSIQSLFAIRPATTAEEAAADRSDSLVPGHAIR
jgi:omega-6 fatty acid desaturase (delta-12 desaturase)